MLVGTGSVSRRRFRRGCAGGHGSVSRRRFRCWCAGGHGSVSRRRFRRGCAGGHGSVSRRRFRRGCRGRNDLDDASRGGRRSAWCRLSTYQERKDKKGKNNKAVLGRDGANHWRAPMQAGHVSQSRMNPNMGRSAAHVHARRVRYFIGRIQGGSEGLEIRGSGEPISQHRIEGQDSLSGREDVRVPAGVPRCSSSIRGVIPAAGSTERMASLRK